MEWDQYTIREFREELGLNQEAFAKKLGISRQQSVSMWETGNHKPQNASRRLLDILRKEYELLKAATG